MADAVPPKCGCYDGPLSSADPSLVSIRCRDHQDVPPLKRHRWIRRDPILGQLRMNEWYENRRRYATPKKRRVPVAHVTAPRPTKAQRKAAKKERERLQQIRELEAAAAPEHERLQQIRELEAAAAAEPAENEAAA